MLEHVIHTIQFNRSRNKKEQQAMCVLTFLPPVDKSFEQVLTQTNDLSFCFQSWSVDSEVK